MGLGGSWRVAQWILIRWGPVCGRAEPQRKPRSRTSTLIDCSPRRAAQGRILFRSHLLPTWVYQRRIAGRDGRIGDRPSETEHRALI